MRVSCCFILFRDIAETWNNSIIRQEIMVKRLITRYMESLEPLSTLEELCMEHSMLSLRLGETALQCPTYVWTVRKMIHLLNSMRCSVTLALWFALRETLPLYSYGISFLSGYADRLTGYKNPQKKTKFSTLYSEQVRDRHFWEAAEQN